MTFTPWENNTVSATGERNENLEFFEANIRWESGNDVREVTNNFNVLTNLRQPIISKDTPRRLGMLPTGYPNQIFYVHAGPSEAQKQADLQKLITEFPCICDGVCRPMAGTACHFELKPDAVPVAIRGSRPVAKPLLPRLKTELDNLEKHNRIKKVIEPKVWVHPIVIVLKKACMRIFHNTKQEYYPLKIRYSNPFPSNKDHSVRNEIFDSHWCPKRLPSDPQSTANSIRNITIQVIWQLCTSTRPAYSDWDLFLNKKTQTRTGEWSKQDRGTFPKLNQGRWRCNAINSQPAGCEVKRTSTTMPLQHQQTRWRKKSPAQLQEQP